MMGNLADPGACLAAYRRRLVATIYGVGSATCCFFLPIGSKLKRTAQRQRVGRECYRKASRRRLRVKIRAPEFEAVRF
jgi:flagellar motor component MotA